MRKIVSNTTPILSLLKIGKFSLLKELYEKVIVPTAVYVEIENGKEKPYYQDLTQIDWIEIQEIRNLDSKAYFLDLGWGSGSFDSC
jgi:predicted nucleic acid-binding protein